MKTAGWNRFAALGALAVVLGVTACSKEAPTPTQDATVATSQATAAASASAGDVAATTAEPASAAAPGASSTAVERAPGSPTSPGGAAPVASAVAATSGTAAVADVPAPAASSAAPEPAAPSVDGEKKTGAQYAAFLSGPKKVKAGSTVSLAAIFTASGNYHCNEKYPTSFKPDAAPEGVTFASDKFSSASFSAKRSTVPVTLTASSKGAKRVSGTLKFGVCDESECIPVKTAVSFAFDVE